MASRTRPTPPHLEKVPFDLLVVDVGGTNVKLRATGQKKRAKIRSGKNYVSTPDDEGYPAENSRVECQAVSIGLPGLVLHGRILHEPRNLGKGWVGFDFGKAFRLHG